MIPSLSAQAYAHVSIWKQNIKYTCLCAFIEAPNLNVWSGE
jgi:hypothetical protein